jgi:hypothetical protein
MKNTYLQLEFSSNKKVNPLKIPQELLHQIQHILWAILFSRHYLV